MIALLRWAAAFPVRVAAALVEIVGLCLVGFALGVSMVADAVEGE